MGFLPPILMPRGTVRPFDTSARDGVQAVKTFIPTENKIKFINFLSNSGIKDLEVTSVTSLNQMRDAKEVFENIIRCNGVRYWVLVPNLKGFNTVFDWRGKHVGLISSASDSFSKRNVKMGIEEAIEKHHIPILKTANKCEITVRAYLSCSFGNEKAGDVSEEKVVELCHFYRDLGARVVICDTNNLATVDRVDSLMNKLVASGIDPDEDLAVHLHGSGKDVLTKIETAVRHGVREVDTSIRGLGGCPAAQALHGKDLNNAPTEEAVNAFESKGYHTGVNTEQLRIASDYIHDVLRNLRA